MEALEHCHELPPIHYPRMPNSAEEADPFDGVDHASLARDLQDEVQLYTLRYRRSCCHHPRTALAQVNRPLRIPPDERPHRGRVSQPQRPAKAPWASTCQVVFEAATRATLPTSKLRAHRHNRTEHASPDTRRVSPPAAFLTPFAHDKRTSVTIVRFGRSKTSALGLSVDDLRPRSNVSGAVPTRTPRCLR